MSISVAVWCHGCFEQVFTDGRVRQTYIVSDGERVLCLPCYREEPE